MASLFPDESRIYGCWLGKSIGGTLGIPAEGSTRRLNYTFYDPLPSGAVPNDDLELQLVWLHLLETRGLSLTQKDLADGWLSHIHYMWDEYGRCRWNLRRGVPPASCGTFENPFQSAMGSPIRSEIWACICHGDVELAAQYAALDSSLDHGPDGIAGEVFNAVMQTLVLDGHDIVPAIRRAMATIDPTTETSRALHLVSELFDRATEAWACRDRILVEHGSDNFTHAPLNLALTAWSLFYGGGDFEKTILLAVNGGFDTDCIAATAGATLGLKLGADAIPARWSNPIGDEVGVGPGIISANPPATLKELTDRTVRIAEAIRLERASGFKLTALPRAPDVRLSDLRATIDILPLDDSKSVSWSNGELPEVVKAAGGATWSWDVAEGTGQRFDIVVTVPDGARLFIDDNLALDCPPGINSVPAPHRVPKSTKFSAHPARGGHSIRIELSKPGAHQTASVILAEANQHLAPWTGEQLPFEPTLS